ncbi:hypothetical protein GCM10027155_07620 [Acinetobacter apis]|uniref:Uncharacterized protein n=2 Tax=Acinetobacter apis TaxID=1229165 RepID=A0A217EEB2_9GAMM|nr:hypothetical protein SAMN05444584_0769 [Acinetobacter apis]
MGMRYISSELNHFISRIKLFRSLIKKQDFKAVQRYYERIYIRWLDHYSLPQTRVMRYEDPIELRALDELFVDCNIDDRDVLNTLNLWHKQDAGFLSSVLLAEYWAAIANDVQHHLPMQHTTKQRSIFVDVSIYWYLHAMSFMSRCPDIYIRILELLINTHTSYTPTEIYQLQTLQHINYSADSIEKLSDLGGELPLAPISPCLIQPNIDADTTSAYLFQCSLAHQPTFYAYRHYVLNILKLDTDSYPLFDCFLYSDQCDKLPNSVVQPLYCERYLHELERLQYDNALDVNTLLHAEEIIDYLHSLSIDPIQKVDVFIAEICFYTDVIHTMQGLSEPLKEIIFHKLDAAYYTLVGQHQNGLQQKLKSQERIFQCILLFYQSCFEHQKLAYLENFILRTAACKRSSFFMLLWYALSESGKYNLCFAQLDIDLALILSTGSPAKVDMQIQQAWLALCEIGERHIIETMLQKLAEAGHAQSMMQMYCLYLGSHVDGLYVPHQMNIQKADYWLQHALDQEVTAAYLEQGEKLLQQVLDNYPHMVDRDMIQSAYTWLEKAVKQHDHAAFVPYAHAIFLAEPTQRDYILTDYLPYILEHHCFTKKHLAQIAYIYACANLYAQGMANNIYLAQYWSKNALQLDPQTRYQVLSEQIHVPEGFGLAKMKYKKQIQSAKNAIPTWMKSVIQLYERHLIF